MNVLSLNDEKFCSERDTLLSQLDEKISALGWIWGSGEDHFGFWCEIYTPQKTTLVRATSLIDVLRLAIEAITP